MRTLKSSSTVLMHRRRRLRHRRHRPRYFRLGVQTGLVLLVMAGTLLLASGALMAGAGLRIYSVYAAQLPDIEALTRWEEEFQTVSIYDRTGEHLLLLSLDPRPFSGDRTYMSLTEMSPWVWQAAVALEDRSFWTNPGISLRGITRAFVSNLAGEAVQGGSSITQQLIKNIAIPFEDRAQRSYARKVKEVILSLELTRKYDKQQILEWYLNFNFYGNLAYGVEAASRVYFGKSSADLSLAEAAMLAPIPQYQAMNPFYLPERAKARQRLALDGMVETGYITQAQANAAFAEELVYATGLAERFDVRLAPHFGLYVLEQLQREFNTVEEPFFIWKKGLKVRTTLDMDLQQFTEEAARTQIAQLEAGGHNASNTSVVAMEPATGEILTLLGSVDYTDRTIDGQVNVALANRQPGSSFKPYVYIAALERGMTAADMILDVRTPFRLSSGSIYVPENFDLSYHGPVSLRTALARSYNIPSIKIMETIGLADAIRTSQRLGITGLDRGTQFYGLSLVLGGGEISLLDHTYAYSVLGNGGVMAGQPVPLRDFQNGFRRLDPIAILEITDADGNILRQQPDAQQDTVLSPEVHYIITDILSDDQARAAVFGSNSVLTLADRKVAAKTGTTNNIRDTWTLGYTPQLAVGVWVGNTDNTPMRNLSGLTGAAPLWHAVMRKYHEDKPFAWYPRPQGVVSHEVCMPSGLQVTPQCQSRRREWFVDGTQPERPDNIWQAFTIDSGTGQLANASTPPARRETEYFQILPIEAQDWIRETGFPQPPTASGAPTARTNTEQTVGIRTPAPESYVRFSVPVRGFVRAQSTHSWRLDIVPATDSASPVELASGQGRTYSEDLAELATASWPDGFYTLRLTVQHFNGVVEQVNTPLFIDNTAPEVTLVSPAHNQIFVREINGQVNIHVDASDAGSIAQVEFWFNDELIKTRTVPPYNERWRISMRDLPAARFAEDPRIGTRQTVDPHTGQVLSEVPTVVESTGDWFPDFNTENVVLTRGRVREFASGFAAIRTSNNLYLERNVIQIRVRDRAGNEVQTPKVHIYVMHADGTE